MSRRRNMREWEVTLIVRDTDPCDPNDPDHGFLSKADIIAEMEQSDGTAGITRHNVKARLLRKTEQLKTPAKKVLPARRIKSK